MDRLAEHAADAARFIRVCAVDDIPQGGVVRAEVDDTPVAVVRTTDPDAGDSEAVYAIYDECSHAEVPLSEGDVEDCTLECWLHGSRFDLRTGEPTGLPATEPVPVYPVEIRDGDVYLCLTPDNATTTDAQAP